MADPKVTKSCIVMIKKNHGVLVTRRASGSYGVTFFRPTSFRDYEKGKRISPVTVKAKAGMSVVRIRMSEEALEAIEVAKNELRKLKNGADVVLTLNSKNLVTKVVAPPQIP